MENIVQNAHIHIAMQNNVQNAQLDSNEGVVTGRINLIKIQKTTLYMCLCACSLMCVCVCTRICVGEEDWRRLLLANEYLLPVSLGN